MGESSHHNYQLLFLLNLRIIWILIVILPTQKKEKKPVNSENKPKIWIEMAGEQIIKNHCGDWLYLSSRIFWLGSEHREAPDATHSTCMRSFVPRTDMFDCVCQRQDCLSAYQDLKTTFNSLSMNKRQGEKKQTVSFFRVRSCRVLSCNLVGRLWVSMSWEQQRLQRRDAPIPRTCSKGCPLSNSAINPTSPSQDS